MLVLGTENVSTRGSGVKTKQWDPIMNCNSLCNSMYKYLNAPINNTRDKITQQLTIT